MSASTSSSVSASAPEAKVGDKRKQTDEKEEESPIVAKKGKADDTTFDLAKAKGKEWFECKCHASVYASPEWYNSHKKQLDESDIKMCQGYVCCDCKAETQERSLGFEESESDDDREDIPPVAFYCAACSKDRFRVCPECGIAQHTDKTERLVCDDCWPPHCTVHQLALKNLLWGAKAFVPTQ